MIGIVKEPAAERKGIMDKIEEPVFVNHTEMDKERYFEAVRARGNKVSGKVYFLLGAVIAVLGLATTQFLVAAAGILIAILATLSHVIIGYRDFHKLEEVHPGGKWSKTLLFYEDRVEADSGTGKVTTAYYDAIKHEYETKNMYVIEFGKQDPAMAFSKDGFTVGNMEACKAFLLEQQRKKWNATEEREQKVKREEKNES